MKLYGLTLTDAQWVKCKALASHPDIVAAREVITLYKSHDQGLALFRTTAGNRIAEITVRAALNKPLTVGLARYVNAWLIDSNPMFCDFFRVLNDVLGREYIQGVPK